MMMTVMVEAVNLAVPALNLLHPRGCVAAWESARATIVHSERPKTLVLVCAITSRIHKDTPDLSPYDYST